MLLHRACKCGGRLAGRRLGWDRPSLTCQVVDAVEVVTAAPTRPAVQPAKAGVRS
jgi:hypothetical protein